MFLHCSFEGSLFEIGIPIESTGIYLRKSGNSGTLHVKVEEDEWNEWT